MFESGTNIFSESQISKMYLLSSCNSTQIPFSNSSDTHMAKRARSLPHSHSDEELNGRSFTLDDSEREMEAKAKRLIRFRDDMIDDADPKHANKEGQHILEERAMNTTTFNADVLYEHCMSVSENAVVGLCFDMCPESERVERERKGDLDPYERLNGDSKQTTEFIAVKKYSRTASRDSHLIRPMPVLHETINYLLSLLNRSYDDQFLGVYNFLWDRMRAVRMDLRMQHIFNHEAITMLEKMIRLHIIAMHELCEFSKGEGFSEGFDAHLNIEQMNKTSVELFEMYDDYGKKGKHMEMEREFRGYYALLKLDKHPGYNVEPQELSLDLSNMSPEMRNTPEVLFARNVTRACRTCNFVAFFRLVRKASYLQACLMHAHFGKLRTCALASLHSGLQNNQGIPVSDVATWLGMKREDILDLLSYHGFIIKEYKEPYMIRGGPFLNSENDYPTRRSELVHMKRSKTVVEDVSFSFLPVISATKNMEEIKPVMVETTNFVEICSPSPVDEEMSDTCYEFLSSPGEHSTKEQHHICQTKPFYEDDSKIYTHQKIDNEIHENVSSQNNSMFLVSDDQSICISIPETYVEEGGIPSISIPDKEDAHGGSHTAEEKSQISPTVAVEVKSGVVESYSWKSNENEEMVSNHFDQAVNKEKLISILRLWRRRASDRKELQRRRLLAANNALNFLSLGPPIPMGTKSEGFSSYGDFKVDNLLFELHKKRDDHFTVMNLSEIVSSELCKRDVEAEFVSWKVAVCPCTTSALGSWLLSTLIPKKASGLVSSSPGISIWKKCVPREGGIGMGMTCCFSVVKKVSPGDQAGVFAGVESLVIPLCKALSPELQKNHVRSILGSFPDSPPPLLVLTDLRRDGASALLQDVLMLFYGVDRPLKCRILVISGVGELRDGLCWLAGLLPPQPAVRAVRIRDLVVHHFNQELRTLLPRFHITGPDRYVLAVNGALDRSMADVSAAAGLKPLHWPSPELDALFPEEEGWWAESTIERVARSLAACRLPSFPDLTAVPQETFCSASGMGRVLSELEGCLTGYLGGVTGTIMARREANLLLKKHTRLELCEDGRNHRLVPKWAAIFRRIVNWTLAGLSNGEYGSGFTLVVGRGESDCEHEDDNDDDDDVRVLQASDPCLDEVVAGMGWRNEEAVVEETEGGIQCEIEVQRTGTTEEMVEEGGEGGEGGVVEKYGGDEELERLLQECEAMQKKIDEKLSIYF